MAPNTLGRELKGEASIVSLNTRTGLITTCTPSQFDTAHAGTPSYNPCLAISDASPASLGAVTRVAGEPQGGCGNRVSNHRVTENTERSNVGECRSRNGEIAEKQSTTESTESTER